MEVWRRFIAFVNRLDLSGVSPSDEAPLQAYTAELWRLAARNGQALQAAYQRHDGRN